MWTQLLLDGVFSLLDAYTKDPNTSRIAHGLKPPFLHQNTHQSIRFSLNAHSIGDMDADYNFYWETKRFLESEDLDRWACNSSSPDNGATNEKNSIVLERNRRRKLNAALYNLRGVVPNITRMDKPSIIKDAIVYIEELQKQERWMMAEISETESCKTIRPSIDVIKQYESVMTTGGKRRRLGKAPSLPTTPSIDVMELRVCNVGDKTLVIHLTCKKEGDTVMNICDVFRSLNLKIITANLCNLSGTLFHTVFVESEDVSCDLLKEKIEGAVAKLNAEISSLSSMGF